MIYRFGTFEFEPSEGVLRREGRPVPLEPKPARALALLLERAGALVTRDEMRAHLWDAGTHVDFDRALAYCIGQVRQALGDSAENPRFIQTVPRRGFKFIVPIAVHPTAGQAAATANQGAQPATAPIATPPIATARSYRRWAVGVAAMLVVALIAWTVVQGRPSSSPPIVAVALFDNETGDASHDRSLSRMTDTVVERLAALGTARIGVVGNHSLLRQPRPGRDLAAIEQEIHASFVVLVQLQNRAPDLSLLLQLIRMSDGVHIWVRRLPLTAEDVDRADERVADRIDAAVRRYVLGEAIEAP